MSISLAPSLPVSGRVILIFGPMFAGKTNYVLNVIDRYEQAEKKVLVLRPHIDKRYTTQDYIVAHNQRKKACFVCDEQTMMDPLSCGEIVCSDFDVCIVDEGQFFNIDGLRDFCRYFADERRKTIYIAALDGDFNRNVFRRVTDLVPLADEVIKLSAICKVCKRDGAAFTWRKVYSTELVVIGGAEQYMAVCRVCYNELKSSGQST